MKWKKNIALFIASQGLTLFGSMLVYYAILWNIVLESQSGMMMMFLTIAGVLPMFFISPFGGVWADRYNKKLLINAADAGIAFVTLLLAIMFSLGYDYIGLLLICSVMRSLGQGIQMPAVNALIPELVPAENLTRVNGAQGSVQSVVMLVTPMAAGALLSFLPISVILFIDVITAAIGISILYFFVEVKHKKAKKNKKSTYISELKEGFAYTKKHTFIKRFLILSVIFNLTMSPTAILTPLQVARDFGTEYWRLTTIEVIFFIGSILGGLSMAIWGGFKNKSHTLALSTIMSGVAIVTLGFMRIFWLYVACMCIAGIFLTMFNAPMAAIMQTNVNEKYMGRVFSLMAMVSSIAMPAGMLIWGPLSDYVEISHLLIGTGISIFLIGFVFIYDKSLLKAGIAEKVEKNME